MDNVTISREEYESMKKEIETLRNSKLYKRLVEFEENIRTQGKYTRNNLGF
ncbi:MAG: hypothetical protein ACMXYL_00540 [Candidatus Woesearchaeota archaeon]